MERVITGEEEQIDIREPEGALAEFYRAFNHRDLALMAKNWDSTDEASMDNPLGGIRRGWADIRSVYERIFGGEARVRVEFHDFTLHQFGQAFVAVGRERGTLQVNDTSLDLKIRTTRFFAWRTDRWRQIHHHGSIEDPELLARYQGLIQKTPPPKP